MSPELWTAYFTLLAFFFGACVGSFLNVCIHRIPREESVVKPRSHCPGCGKLIAWYDNIPMVSWFVLRAKCRHCKTPISPRYVFVETLTAVLFLAVWNRYGASDPALTLVYWVAISGLILGTFVDFEHMIIPDRVTIGGMLLGPVLSLAVPSMQGTEDRIQAVIQSVIGLAAGAGLLYPIGLIGKLLFRKDAMGLGDVKLLGAIGAFFGWTVVPFTIFVSSIFGSLVGVSLIIARRLEASSRIPFGPYLALAAVVWMLGGREFWLDYWSWIKELR